jgi:transposase
MVSVASKPLPQGGKFPSTGGTALRARSVRHLVHSSRAATDLTDEQWEHVRPLVPGPSGLGRPRADDRRVLNGILQVLCNGVHWRDVPGRYASRATCHRRFIELQYQEAWGPIWTAYLARLEPQQRRRCLEASQQSAADGQRSI